jgi:signal transduction histidine kinase
LFARFFKFGLAALLFAWLAALSVVAWLVFQGYEAALERGERTTATLAAVVEQQTGRTFQAVQLTLGAVGDSHQLAPRPARHDPGFQQMMARRLADIPFVRALFVIGPDGLIVHDTDHPATPDVSLAHRPYYRAHAQDAHHPGGVWPPLESHSGTGWFLPVTRPLGRFGRFEGVVVAAVQADHFEAQFSAIGLEKGYLVALFYLDGTLVARHPRRRDDVARDFSHLPIFASHLPEKTGTFWTARSSLAPGPRVVSYRVVENLPFVLHVSRAKQDVLAEWRRTATAAAVGMGSLTALLAWFIALLVRDRARRARERERRAQAEKLEALGQLTAGIAHDFGNLLQVVAMNNEVMRQAPLDPLITKQALATNERAVRGGMAMLDRLTSFARIRPLTMTRLRLDAWLEAARPLLVQAAGPWITLRTAAKPPLPEILCDVPQLDAAVVNLVVNARDAMRARGQIGVRVYACDHESGAPTAFAGSPPPFVCLAVQDSGPGMSDEVRRRATEPFYTTKGEDGTGLGLSQVYGFMRQVGGDMAIDSAPGRGTTVHLFFPVAGAARTPQQ